MAPSGLLDPASADLALAPNVPVLWNGTQLRGEAPKAQEQLDVLGKCIGLGECRSATAQCDEGTNCARHEISVPIGAPASDLVVGLRWRSADTSAWFALAIEDAVGAVLVEGRSITIDHNGASAVLENAMPGTYRVVVAAMWGASTYEVAAQLRPRAEVEPAARELLPDIVTLPPTDLRFEDPSGHFFMNMIALPTNGIASAMGAKYCSSDEASVGARKCLRFSNAVANLGEGPLDVALTPTEGATHMAGGRFVQRIVSTDGSVRESPAGAAEFHAIHGHWHNAGSNHFQIYAWDEATSMRGDPVAEGRKTGMCFADVGVADPAWPGLEWPAHQGVQCFNPAKDQEWSMGLSPGWYDNYPWVLNDQYVDVADLADGVYLLCSSANADGFLVETVTTNNEGCTRFRLEGDTVETLDPLPYHAELA